MVLPMSAINPAVRSDDAIITPVTDHPRPFGLIKKKELAKILSISPRTIDSWIAQRRIPALKFGRRCVRFDLQEVREALRHFRIEASAREPKASNTRHKPHLRASSSEGI